MTTLTTLGIIMINKCIIAFGVSFALGFIFQAVHDLVFGVTKESFKNLA